MATKGKKRSSSANAARSSNVRFSSSELRTLAASTTMATALGLTPAAVAMELCRLDVSAKSLTMPSASKVGSGGLSGGGGGEGGGGEDGDGGIGDGGCSDGVSGDKDAVDGGSGEAGGGEGAGGLGGGEDGGGEGAYEGAGGLGGGGGSRLSDDGGEDDSGDLGGLGCGCMEAHCPSPPPRRLQPGSRLHLHLNGPVALSCRGGVN